MLSKAILAALPCALCLHAAVLADFQISPATVTLQGNYARAQLLVTATDPSAADFTHRAVFKSSDAALVQINATGQLLAVGNGDAAVTVTVDGVSHVVPVKVSNVVAAPEIDFGMQVMPIISKLGCNAGACHASQYGKGGFKLSVFGYAPEEDYQAIVRDRMGRRVCFEDAAQSLFLLKPTACVPHGGGRRLEAGSVEYQVLARWIASGALGPTSKTPQVASLSVSPTRRAGKLGLTQQLQVIAHYSDGSQRDVTVLARYDSMDEAIVRVTPQGWMQTIGKGQGTVMVRFQGQAQITQVVVPYADGIDLAGWTDNNFIDRLAAAKFREIGIAPSGLCDDATFLRRAYLEVLSNLVDAQLL